MKEKLVLEFNQFVEFLHLAHSFCRLVGASGIGGPLAYVLTSDFVPFVGDPRECRGDVAFPPSFGPQPSGAIEETGTIFESTL